MLFIFLLSLFYCIFYVTFLIPSGNSAFQLFFFSIHKICIKINFNSGQLLTHITSNIDKCFKIICSRESNLDNLNGKLLKNICNSKLIKFI